MMRGSSFRQGHSCHMHANKPGKYQEKLYEMDKELIYEFQFKKFQHQEGEKYETFLKNNPNFINEVIQYFITLIQEQASIAFNFLFKGTSQKSQAKNYFSKNVLENLNSFCFKLAKQFRFQKEMRKVKKESQEGQEEIQVDPINDIINLINNSFKTIVQKVVGKYPKGQISGYSQKLKQKIRKIDYRQNSEVQFLYLANIVISNDQFRKKYENLLEGTQQEKKEEYLKRKIKDFLNKVIELSREKNIYQSQSKNQQMFYNFNRRLVFIISNNQITEYQSNFLSFLIQNNQIKQTQRLNQLRDLYQETQIKVTKFQANAKIGKNIQSFQPEAQLKIKRSSLLRVLTKWIDDFKQTFEKRQKYIKNNSYKFKNNRNSVNQLHFNQRQILNEVLEEGWSEFQVFRKRIQKVNKDFVVELLKEQNEGISYQFESSLSLSTHLNTYIIKDTIALLIKLITIFLQIPQKASNRYREAYIQKIQKQSYTDMNKPPDQRQYYQKQRLKLLQSDVEVLKNINLVNNRIGDLLRSTIRCTEAEFIKLLTVLYQLDSYSRLQINKLKCKDNNKKIRFFELIRIKDKLEEATNDVLINYMFYQNIQCQLQVCFEIDEKKKKQQITNIIHHTLYELKRGIFGIIPQLAIIIKQYDPFISNNHSPFLDLVTIPKKDKKDKGQLSQRKYSNTLQNKIFWRCININCKYFSVFGNHKFIRENNINYCLACYINFKGNKQIQQPKRKKQALIQLQYEQKDKWVIQLLKTDNALEQFNEKKLMKRTDYKQESYLIIHPTDQKIQIGLCLIFKNIINDSWIVQSLKQQNKKQQQIQDITKQHQNNQKFYYKIQQTHHFYKFLQQQNKEELRKLFTLSHIQAKKKEGQKRSSKGFAKKQLQNKQVNLRLNDNQGSWQKLQQYSTILNNNPLKTIQRLEAECINIESLQICNKLQNLQVLYLAKNKIKWWEKVKLPHLRVLDISNNELTVISINWLDNLRQLKLNNNRLRYFIYFQLKYLQDLQLENNEFQNALELQNLPNLKNLNINYNNRVSKLFVGSSKLSTLCCKKKIDDVQQNEQSQNVFNNQGLFCIQIQLPKGNVLKELISVNNIIYGRFFKQNLLERVQKLILQINDSNYNQLINLKLKQVERLSLHFLNFTWRNQQQINRLQQFIIKQNMLTDLQLVFKDCVISSLNLSRLQPIQKIFFQISNQQEMFKLKLNSIEDMVLRKGIKVLTADWKSVKKMTMQDLKLEDPLPFQEIFKNKNIEKITINECYQVRNIYGFSNYLMLKQLKISMDEQFIKNFSLTDNPLLQSLELNFKTQSIEIKNCNQLKTVLIFSDLQKRIKLVKIDLPNLEFLNLRFISIKQLHVLVSAQKIKRIHFDSVFVEQSILNVHQSKDQTINLEELKIGSSQLQILYSLLGKVSNIKRATFTFEPQDQNKRPIENRNQSLPLSRSIGRRALICRNINELTLASQQTIKDIVVVIDSAVCILYLSIEIKLIVIKICRSNSILYVRQDNDASIDLTRLRLQIINAQQIEQNEESPKVIFQVDQSRMAAYQSIIKNKSRIKHFVRSINNTIVPSTTFKAGSLCSPQHSKFQRQKKQLQRRIANNK